MARTMLLWLFAILLCSVSFAQQKPVGFDERLYGGLKYRNIGPFRGGRSAAVAGVVGQPMTFYFGGTGGGVWKTTNGGITFDPVFDGAASYSVGCLAIDAKNPNVIWVGSGENNSQRSVGFGDGVYRSRDGGKSWENLGLKDSEHIGKIAIDPRDSNVIYVAAQGPLWRSGPERGLYKTTNGGRTWVKILDCGEDTGVNEVHIHPADPNTLIASAYQRRRHVWTLINGGPASAIYKSTDAGATWRKITAGIPGEDKGRIGLAISPANAEIVYAMIELPENKGGIFRSVDRGETWEKRSDYIATSPQYYTELVCDPANADHLYSLDTILMESADGGRNWQPVPETNRHVDHHALWIDPQNAQHLIVGCDGGLYDSFDRGTTWRHAENLPITQFYRVAVDNSKPFYYIYGGTQDNNTLGGPSRTLDQIGVANEHWFNTVGGDGFEPAIDPEDPMIVYSQWQHGGLVRFDRRSGETVDIKPREKPGEPGLRWNWDSPLVISPHNHKRLYFAANAVFRSDDRGDSWTAISGDLTRQIDRNQLTVMGRVQPAEAVAKSNSTSFYGNIVSLHESPLVEGLIYVGTDDGLIQVTETGGKSWRAIDTVPGVPERTYVSCLRASQHDADTVYASFDNHKMGDFKPYVMKSTDRGATWTSIAGDLPEREIVYSIAEDHVTPRLLFVGTEFGVFCSLADEKQAGKQPSSSIAPTTTAPATSRPNWMKLRSGLPPIPVRDIDIQQRENDLVLATFGRGFYILDDYSALRQLTPAVLEKDASILPIKDALHYVPMNRLGGGNGKGWAGASHYAAPNPPFGATITYYVKEKLRTRKELRKEEEQKAAVEGRVAAYPTIDELRAEEREREPQVFLTIRDSHNEVVRRIAASREKGVHRANWDLRLSATTPVNLGSPIGGDSGALVSPGDFTVTLSKIVDGVTTEIAGPETVHVIPLDLATFAAKDREERLAFNKKVGRLQRAVQGAGRAFEEAQARIAHLRQAVLTTPNADPAILTSIDTLQLRMSEMSVALYGDATRDRRNEARPPSISDRVETVAGDLFGTTSAPTKTQVDGFQYAGDAFEQWLNDFRALVEKDLRQIEEKLEQAGAPWTPGRMPTWKRE